MKNLRDLSYEDLLAEVAELGEKPYRAEQLYGWIFHKNATEIDQMTDISKVLRERLKGEYYIKGIETLDVKTSPDGTRKFLSGLEDGCRIESVLIPEDDRLTLCVSSQAGCALGCQFCMTGMSGFVRNLRLSELTGQVFSAMSLLNEGERITNIVLMGMGEPLANYDNVVKFLKILSDGKGFNFSHNKITVSTAGLVPAIRKFGYDSKVNLAVSLNATTDEVRSRIMPINKKYPIDELLSALRAYPLHGKKYITIEYVLIKNVNDSIEDANRLIKILRGVECKINLIAFNPYPGTKFQRPEEQRVNYFHKIISDAGYVVIVRASKGREIQAACGQLKGAYDLEENAPGQ
ncbi:MAG: 23S rRNA (adenine(2503)-C(2))-methyltransferase RlmN [Deltaproteobacteria bacterium]|nr:23S rRNA (adenine(2503)-C(2))-methyltransferase RlmN [Deltaproteobacteria bacterium]